jgi:hypothetical protein
VISIKKFLMEGRSVVFNLLHSLHLAYKRMHELWRLVVSGGHGHLEKRQCFSRDAIESSTRVYSHRRANLLTHSV